MAGGCWSCVQRELYAAGRQSDHAPDVHAHTRVILFSISAAPGFQREFSLKELSIQHSFATHERVPLRSVAGQD